MNASRDFYAGLGALIYAIAKADEDGVEQNEVEKTGKELLKNFGDRVMSTTGLRAAATVESFARQDISAEEAYKRAMDYLTLDTRELKHFRDKVVEILDQIANADNDLSEKETAFIDRFKQETAEL